jgi:uncharacterized phage-associated protein
MDAQAITPHDARAIANHFLDVAAAEGKSLDHLQVQKLTYFAHGWHLAVTGEPLIFQNVQAWPYGPVVPEVYEEFKSFGRNPIDGRALTFDGRLKVVPFRTDLLPISDHVLSRVWQSYKGHSGLEMSAIAHEEGTPWYQMVGHLKPKEIRDVVIPNVLIRQHYLKLGKERQGLRATKNSQPI